MMKACEFGECTEPADRIVTVLRHETPNWERPMCAKCAAFAKKIYNDETGYTIEEKPK